MVVYGRLIGGYRRDLLPGEFVSEDAVGRVHFCRKPFNLKDVREATKFAKDKSLPGQVYTITKEVRLSGEDFLALCSDFFESQSWLTKDDGGRDATGRVYCILVINEGTGEKLLINNEAYDYCRYVALID